MIYNSIYTVILERIDIIEKKKNMKANYKLWSKDMNIFQLFNQTITNQKTSVLLLKQTF